MDDVRGTFGTNENADQTDGFEPSTTDAAQDRPPAAIGTDERRMQVRAYNHWAGLLGERNFPSIEELNPQDIADFGPNSVLLDFSSGIDDPSVQFLGDKLAEECGATGPIKTLGDVPARSLLSRITDHYMQILANEAPIGFEAEFVNHEGASILYRGILLPYSSDDETIDFIYGVINWKEMADQATADELLLEIDQALEAEAVDETEAHKHPSDPVTPWAASSLDDFDELESLTSPNEGSGDDNASLDVFELELGQIEESEATANVDEAVVNGESAASSEGPDKTASLLDIRGCDAEYDHELSEDLDLPDFSQYKLEDPEGDEFESGEDEAAYHFASLADYIETPAKKAIDLDAEVNVPPGFDAEAYESGLEEQAAAEYRAADADTAPFDEPLELDVALEFGDANEFHETLASDDGKASGLSDANEEVAHEISDPDSGLYDCLASARELAQTAIATEDRSRLALYAAVGRAYDFSLEAKDAPESYAELIAENSLSVQERAPMTPIVKLVFGSGYDKTRLTEYAAVLSHAHRLDLSPGSLAEFLGEAQGGLKGIVQAERRLRREESGKPVAPKLDAPRAALAKKLRRLEESQLTELSADGPEFALVMVRRDGKGGVCVLGEIGDDVPLIERAAKKLIS